MKKATLIKRVVDHLVGELELFHRAAKAAFDEATDEQNKAENKYDTRGLEASYLARGQARQVADTEQAIAQFQSLSAQELGPDARISLGALVELEHNQEIAWYFLGPCAGGTEIRDGKRTILVITPQSPLGQQLVGHQAGKTLTLTLGSTQKQYKLLSVT